MKNYKNLDGYHQILPGWDKIIEYFLDDCEQLCNQYGYKINFATIKEKFGEIRVYSESKPLHPSQEINSEFLKKLDNLKSYLTYLSINTCSCCAAPGNRRKVLSTLVATMCNNCAKETNKYHKIHQVSQLIAISRQLYDWGKQNNLYLYNNLESRLSLINQFINDQGNGPIDQVSAEKIKTEQELKNFVFTDLPEEDIKKIFYFKISSIIEKKIKTLEDIAYLTNEKVNKEELWGEPLSFYQDLDKIIASAQAKIISQEIKPENNNLPKNLKI